MHPYVHHVPMSPVVSVYVQFETVDSEARVSEHVIREVFEPFGLLTGCFIKSNYISSNGKRQYGYAFVHFESSIEGHECAQRAAEVIGNGEKHQPAYIKNGVSFRCEVSKNHRRASAMLGKGYDEWGAPLAGPGSDDSVGRSNHRVGSNGFTYTSMSPKSYGAGRGNGSYDDSTNFSSRSRFTYADGAPIRTSSSRNSGQQATLEQLQHQQQQLQLQLQHAMMMGSLAAANVNGMAYGFPASVAMMPPFGGATMFAAPPNVGMGADDNDIRAMQAQMQGMTVSGASNSGSGASAWMYNPLTGNSTLMCVSPDQSMFAASPGANGTGMSNYGQANMQQQQQGLHNGAGAAGGAGAYYNGVHNGNGATYYKYPGTSGSGMAPTPQQSFQGSSMSSGGKQHIVVMGTGDLAGNGAGIGVGGNGAAAMGGMYPHTTQYCPAPYSGALTQSQQQPGSPVSPNGENNVGGMGSVSAAMMGPGLQVYPQGAYWTVPQMNSQVPAAAWAPVGGYGPTAVYQQQGTAYPSAKGVMYYGRDDDAAASGSFKDNKT